MKRKNRALLQQILGGLYILAGIGKFIPQLESVEKVLIELSIANKNNWVSNTFSMDDRKSYFYDLVGWNGYGTCWNDIITQSLFCTHSTLGNSYNDCLFYAFPL